MHESATGRNDYLVLPELSEQQRAAYPSIIYEHTGSSADDDASLLIALQVAQGAGLPFIADRAVVLLDEKPTEQNVIRSASTDRHEASAQSALIVGTKTVAVRVLDTENGSLENAQEHAERALRQVADNPELAEAFQEYYGGLRWGTDQEKFVSALFRHGTDFDAAVLDTELKGDDLHYYGETLGHDIPYKISSKWIGRTSDEVFAAMPALDYRKLSNPAFAESEAGQQLLQGYKRLLGTKAAQEHTNHRRRISDDGEIIPRSLIPLTKYPLIEALIGEELVIDGPKPKYSMGPRDLIDIVLCSDSLAVFDILADSATVRVPEDQRRVFDGPREFEHKAGVINAITRAYSEETDPDRREHFKQGIFRIISAYTGDGAIAREVSAQYWEDVRKERSWRSEVSDIKTIVKNILKIGIASPDADAFVRHYVEKSTVATLGEEVVPDALALQTTDLLEVLLSAMQSVDNNSHPLVYEYLARQVFHSDEVAAKVHDIVSLQKQAKELWKSRDIRLAQRELQKTGSPLDDSAGRLEAQAKYDAVTAPVNALFEEVTDATNTLLIAQLENLLAVGSLQAQGGPVTEICRTLIDHVAISGISRKNEMPPAYHELLRVLGSPNASDYVRARAMWHIHKSLRYVGEKTQPLILQFIMDGCAFMLGDDPDRPRLPNSDISSGLACLESLIFDNGSVFKHATEDQLLTLSRYRSGLFALGERLERGDTLGLEGEIAAVASPEWADRSPLQRVLFDVESTIRSFSHMEEKYNAYLHMEEVKANPHVYYPWIMKKLTPFWHKMQHEVAPENRPVSDMRMLYHELRQHITARLDIRQEPYPKNYDVFADGKLGDFLVTCYEQMIVPHQMGYYGVVWNEGRTFMHYAVSFMPESVVQQFRDAYGQGHPFVEYLVRSRTRQSDNTISGD